MNASQLRSALRQKGPCFLFVPDMGTWITINKASLIDALSEFIAEGEDLDAQAEMDGDALFITDFGPKEYLGDLALGSP